ncbi:uncharacterized protein LOC128222119 [Mya arenaria]|uniref:uncharacterized protein LOC128222065 n=1 Tax=Mya arenaria TaxID=6604 RepID=UPI0022E0256C|nr:uncharacterized protein LOC128222065 [Mya arenaria]XP_052786937.1 uncharacterized protein LOC128222119 [Mya arenaria]
MSIILNLVILAMVVQVSQAASLTFEWESLQVTKDTQVGEEYIPIHDISSKHSFDDTPEVVDDDTDGGPMCHKEICKICKTYTRHKACVIAKAVHNAMEVKLVASRHVLVKGKITNNTDVSFCVNHVMKHPDIKSVCIVARNISIKDMSACVNITAQIKQKTFNEAFGCFKIPNKVDEMQAFDSLDSEDIDVVTEYPDSDDNDVVTEYPDSDDIDTVTDSLGSDDEDAESATLELDAFSPFETEDNHPSARLLKAMLTFLKDLKEKKAM